MDGPIRTEKGTVKTPQDCGYQLPWDTESKHHTIFDNALSPTNGKKLSMGKTLCGPNGNSDCQACKGCWELQPEPQNYPSDLKYMNTFRKREWINWGYVDPMWICTYINDPGTIWPGDGRGPEPDPADECPDKTYDPPTTCDKWPNNWADATASLSGDWPDKYAIPVGIAPGLGYEKVQQGPDGHDINTYGEHYGTPEEDWANFCFCYWVDNGVVAQSSSIAVYKNRDDLPDGGNSPGDKTFQRFALLNSRLRELNMNLHNLMISVGDYQISNIMQGVVVPDVKPDITETMEDQKGKKHQYIISLNEKCPEYI